MTTRYSWTTWAPESWRIDCRCRCASRMISPTYCPNAECGVRNAELEGEVVRITTLTLTFRIPHSGLHIPGWGRGRDEGSPHRGHRRPSQRRQVDPLQPLHRRPGCHCRPAPGGDAGSEERRVGKEC